jgi:hypothetical protein
MCPTLKLSIAAKTIMRGIVTGKLQNYQGGLEDLIEASEALALSYDYKLDLSGSSEFHVWEGARKATILF